MTPAAAGRFYIADEEPPVDVIHAAVRRQTIANAFLPVFMGSAYKNKGVQALLDGVVKYLPNPAEVTNKALDLNNDEAEVLLLSLLLHWVSSHADAGSVSRRLC